MTLTEFLLARIADDEWCANHMAERARDWDGDGMNPEGEAIGYEWTAFARRDGEWVRTARLPKHVTPARVLAECDAKRRIVEECDYELDRLPKSPRSRWLAGYTLSLLALPYSDHPDYRDEWKP